MFEAFAIGPLLIWTRALFLLLGIWLAAEFLFRLAGSARLSLKHFHEHAVTYLISFMLMGRIFAIIAEYRIYLKNPVRILIVWDGGFSFIGGMVGIALVLYQATKQHRTTFLQWLDVLLPAACLGLAFDWLGRFAACSSYGRPTSRWFGITCDGLSVRYVVPIYPVQLFYALFYLSLTVVLLVIRKRSQRAGAETLFGICIASIVTFFFEYLRGDFSIPVFATQLDFIVLFSLFLSLGFFAAIEHLLKPTTILLAEIALILYAILYIVLRNWLDLNTFELRFSQFLAILTLLATVVYVIVHRQKYPHL